MDNLSIMITAGSIGVFGSLYLAARLAKRRLQRANTIQLHPASLTFISEQDGPRERTLKAALVTMFQTDGIVQKAYLARLDIGEGFTVGLCLRANPLPDESYPDKIGELFVKVMGPGGHLHVLFLAPDQETELQRVCRPFYETP